MIRNLFKTDAGGCGIPTGFPKFWKELNKDKRVGTCLTLVDICGDYISALVLTHLIDCYTNKENLIEHNGAIWIETKLGHWWASLRIGTGAVKSRASNLYNRGFVDFFRQSDAEGENTFCYRVNFEAIERAVEALTQQPLEPTSI